MSIADLKQRLRDVPGINGLTMQTLVGMERYCFDGKIVSLRPGATVQQIEEAIRNAAAVAERPLEPIAAALSGMMADQAALASQPVVAITPLPTVNITEAPPMTSPAPGSFAASIRAMMDSARADLEQTKADGLAKVGDAIGKMNDAKAATAKVAGTMAKTIEDEAASVLSELGQISNLGD